MSTRAHLPGRGWEMGGHPQIELWGRGCGILRSTHNIMGSSPNRTEENPKFCGVAGNGADPQIRAKAYDLGSPNIIYLRSDWRNFLVNSGTVADRFLAYTYAEITYFTIFPQFLSDFENNGAVKISEFFCVGLAIETNFWI